MCPTTKKEVKVNEKVVRKVESIFKKPYRTAVKLTLSERKFEEEKVVDKMEVSNENSQVESKKEEEVPKGEKKRVRLTIGVKPEEDREKKKKVPKVGRSKSGRRSRAASSTGTAECS